MTITWDWVKFAFFFAPCRVDDSTVRVGSDLLNAVDVEQHVAKSLLLAFPTQLRVVISVTDASVGRHWQVVIWIGFFPEAASNDVIGSTGGRGRADDGLKGREEEQGQS